MFVRELGHVSAPPVLLLHGTPSPASDWLPVAERLASSYHVLIPDLPGYGESPPPTNASYEAVDAEVAAMLAARGAGKLRGVVGFSSGAYRAFELVLRGRVEADVVIGIGAFATFDEGARAARRQIARAMAADPMFLFGPELRAMMHDLMLSPRWLAAHPKDLDRVLGWLRISPPAALRAEIAAMAEISDLRPELSRLTARVYLRVGELDVGAPPATSEEIRRLVPRATMDIVPGCGHSLLIEDLEGTTEAIVRELAAK
jgi:pimeloyl-ACP methyl ester carboxylesterase